MSTVNKPVSEDGKPLEIERKYLIDYPDIRWIEEYPDAKKAEITQVYFDTDEEKRLRVRKLETGGKKYYYLTKKKKISNLVRIEEEWEISEEEYDNLPQKAVGKRRMISKTRYALPYNGRVVEIDIFPFWKDRAIAEVELESEDEEVRLPGEIKIIREVTEEPEYTNYQMAYDVD
ncbi:MAG: hypothetical protein Q4E54_06725 [Lachnospiraceae bacterium]|nr:hypothetical protein [Lachnospiraceae bacterium]